MQTQWIVTGADSHHFANSRMLVASWWDTNRHLPLAYCDFGLTPEQLSEVRSWPVTVLPVACLSHSISSASFGRGSVIRVRYGAVTKGSGLTHANEVVATGREYSHGPLTPRAAQTSPSSCGASRETVSF
jgi:hypothetical protein